MPLLDLHTLGRADPVWLLDLEVAGRTYRVASRPVTVSDAAGIAYRYDGGLVGGVEVDLWAASESAVTISIGEDWAALVAAGGSLDQCPATLRRYYGGGLENARVVSRGVAFGAEYGGAAEPLTVSIGLRPRESADTLPPPLRRVDDSTWPVRTHPNEPTYTFAADPGITGACYPVVFGFPGHRGGGLTPFPACPALMVERDSRGTGGGHVNTSRLLVAGHETTATAVRLWSLQGGLTTDETVATVELVDGLGQATTGVQLDTTSGGWYPPPLDEPWFFGFDESTGGGLPAPGGGTIRGAADVLEWLMARVRGVAFDRGAHAEQADRLNAYKLDFFVNETANAWDLVAEVVKLLPVVETTGQDGLYWAALDYRAIPEHAVRHLSVDAGHVRRVGRIRSATTRIANEITIDYGPWAASAEMTRRRVLTAQPGLLTTWDPWGPMLPTTAAVVARALDMRSDPRVLGDLRCAVSQATYGVKPYTLSTPLIWDDGTAERIARDIAAQMAIPHRVVRYAGPIDLEALRVGSVVTIRDSELSLFDRVGLVAAVQTGGRLPVITLHLPENPATTQRTTV